MSISRHVALVVALCLWPMPAGAQAPGEVNCSGCVVADVRGTVLWGRDENEALPNASSTKIVTALVVLDRVSLSDEVTVSSQAAGTPDGYLGLEAGAVHSVHDLLHGLLMASSNDAAVALAEHVAGSVEVFVGEMNRLASDLGARGTNFTTPHGLDSAGHASTAADLARFAAALLSEPELAEIVATTTYTLADGTAISNSNPLLETYEGAIGVKTGATAEAGEVLVAAATRGRATVIAVALGSPDAAADAATLLDFGFEFARRHAPAAAARRVARGVLVAARSLAAALGSS